MTENNSIYFISQEINTLLMNLTQGIQTPVIQDFQQGNEAERLIEQMEIQNYPYALLHCQHKEEKKIGEDCVECQQQQYETYKDRFLLLLKDGARTHTLKAAFDYYSALITQYRLTECNELLDKIYDFCISRGSWSVYYIMAIQARAFLRFKQKKYQESLDYFKLQLEAIGPNERIFENMARVYLQLNDNKEASLSYARAILLLRLKPEDQQQDQLATLFMGLSSVLDNIEDSLLILKESMKLLKIKYDKPHSLMAKALGAMGDLYMKQNNLLAAEKCYSQAVQIFIDTCGNDTPLTANALNKQGNVLFLLDNKQKSMEAFSYALRVWEKVDNESFEADKVVEALLALSKDNNSNIKDNSGNIKDNSSHIKMFSEIISTLDLLQMKIAKSPEFSVDLNTLCLLKFIYELYIFQGDISRAKVCCKLFKDLLTQLDETKLGELSVYRIQFIQETDKILSIMERL